MYSTIFKEPTSLTYDQDLSVSLVKSYRFAKKLYFIPLLQNEIARAAFDYPILVVKSEEGVFPVALLSLKESENLFINGNGIWEKEFHIPSFVKTYPFIVTQPEWNQEAKVIYDKAYSGINKNDAGKIEVIKDKKLTDSGKKVMDRLNEHYANFERTKQIFQEINKMDLLEEVEVKMAGKEPNQTHMLKGFYQVNAEKLNMLDDESLLKLAKSGALSLINFHLASFSNIQKLKNRL